MQENSFSTENEEAPQFNRVFQETFRQAVSALHATKEGIAALACFRRAYEFRKGFPWLAESRESPDVIGQNGLSYALRSALSCYIVCSPENGERMGRDALLRVEAIEEEWQTGDGEWTASFLEAISATVEEGFSLERFEKHLVRAEVDITFNNLDTLRGHIAAALVRYDERRKMGLSADPF